MKYVKIKTAYACVRFIIIIKTKSWDRELKVASPPSTLMTCNVYYKKKWEGGLKKKQI